MATQVIKGYLYLIDKTSIDDYEDISTNIEPKRINSNIKKAQDLDLSLFMGDAFYYDFINQFDEEGAFKEGTSQLYKDLFNGAVYDDLKGNKVLYQGLVPALAYWTFARFIEVDQIRYTTTGPVQKHHDLSDPATPKQIAQLVEQQRSIANAHANKIEKFLRVHQSSFPLWKVSERNKNSRQPGARIRGVDKTRYNARPYGINGLNDIIY